MTTEVKGVHYEIRDSDREYIDKKLERLDFARNLILEMPFTITKSTKGGFQIETNLHFKWGKSTHLGVTDYDLYKGIETLFDKLETKVLREKNKVQNHKGDPTHRTGEIAVETDE